MEFLSCLGLSMGLLGGQVSIDMNKERNCNVAPELHITWDTEAVGVSPADVLAALDDGEPRIQCAVSQVKRRRTERQLRFLSRLGCVVHRARKMGSPSCPT